ncbi:alkylation response protein AidB-like acyl-CoA dehydrogenase [Saccharothrix tamanrassetensis]|uniref:Alkylation response protein AidB-like acyl-CoA dehydrogenase n=1 Tax=Saccharothrix tamanrassetensis TaxID=1051531 RepID=A0A841CCI8_9PSEU|nr:acyl-CoA dehydrogenase family protein [Saccharothrix tamanrassetensis]MBB5953888.1 alkylation response protein AidB-like acyl-CoA dehydrogenase [Saccharothrix tamanrassetensis]
MVSVETDADVDVVVAAVREAVPRLRANGLAAENARRVPAENLELLERAGVFRIATPRHYGGLDFSLADQARVLAEIARGCGSTSWVAMVWLSSAWMSTLYPEELQREVFATPAPRISGGFMPTGTLVPVDGGYRLNGTWRFNSGCQDADWNMMITLLEHPDGRVDEAVAMVPMSEFTVVDDWHASALAATGSCTTIAEDVFVPAHRVVIPAEAAAQLAEHPELLAALPPGRAYSLYPFLFSQAVSTFIGLAKGAYELFTERLPGRGISYTSWTEQREHPVTQVKVGVAASRIAAAEALAERMYRIQQERADAGEEPTLAERVEIRGQSAFAVRLAKEAVEELYEAAGATAIRRDQPLQRFRRDIEGLSMHGWIVFATNMEVYGRALLGLDPGTEML